MQTTLKFDSNWKGAVAIDALRKRGYNVDVGQEGKRVTTLDQIIKDQDMAYVISRIAIYSP